MGWGPPGFHTTTRELQTCTCQGPALQTPPKFHEKTPRERQKERNWGREKEKKARNFGPPTLRGPTLRAPTFSGFGPHPSAPHPSGLHHDTHQIQNWIGQNFGQNWRGKTRMAKNELAKMGLAQIGQTRMAKTGLAKVGLFLRQTRPPPDLPSPGPPLTGPPLRWTAQNFALFFLLPPQFSLDLPRNLGSSRLLLRSIDPRGQDTQAAG